MSISYYKTSASVLTDFLRPRKIIQLDFLGTFGHTEEFSPLSQIRRSPRSWILIVARLQEFAWLSACKGKHQVISIHAVCHFLDSTKIRLFSEKIDRFLTPDLSSVLQYR